ncbi:MAG: hydroxymethylbilane synthase [Planctomycetota bacterium]|nr:hydroxymethylbilane synthase [Planctomycetota bacterium]
MTKLRIATRSSPLALWQANHVAASLSEKIGIETELLHVSTLGDRDRVDPLASFGGMGVFTREVQRAVLDGRADIAVHSLKDLPTVPEPGLVLAAVPERASRYDALVLPSGVEVLTDVVIALAALPEQGRVGTGSPRRRSQLLRLRPDLRLEEVRGNVETRLRKLDEGSYDALVLAEAGLVRLGLGERITARLAPPVLFPSVGQGALGVECRSDDVTTSESLAALDHATTRAEVTAERAALAALRAGCHAPVGALATIAGDRLSIRVIVLSADGRERFQATADGPIATAAEIGRAAAMTLLDTGAARLLA